jgi:hypothetical protein
VLFRLYLGCGLSLFLHFCKFVDWKEKILIKMSNEGMKVFVRVRPPISREIDYTYATSVHSNSKISVSTANNGASAGTSDRSQTSTCVYDRVFNEVCQQSEVFESIKPLLSDVLSGYNACLFAYGQTSAGKNYTIIGPNGGQDILHQPQVCLQQIHTCLGCCRQLSLLFT